MDSALGVASAVDARLDGLPYQSVHKVVDRLAECLGLLSVGSTDREGALSTLTSPHHMPEYVRHHRRPPFCQQPSSACTGRSLASSLPERLM